MPGWHHDHVLAEWWDGERWVWSDPELDPAGDRPFDGYDIDPEAGHFESAARVWLAYRAGRLDPDTYGVDPSLPFRGDWFIHDYVLLELAHRHKDEVLLWDGFGAMTEDLTGADLTLVDEVAALLVAADRGDARAQTAVRQAGDWLGFGVANLVNIFNPEMVIFGGTMRDLYLASAAQVRSRLNSNGLPACLEHVRLRTPKLGDDAALIGAAELAFERLLADPLN